MAFATAADMLDRYDHRVLADLCSDTGEPISDIANSPRLIAALEDAAGQILAAAMVGQMYTADDLSQLIGPAQGLLQRLNCELALCYLLSARPERYGSDSLAAARQQTEEYLSMLRRGERIFPQNAAAAAGLPTVDGPTVADYARLNLLPERAHQVYPRRGTRLPLGRQ